MQRQATNKHEHNRDVNLAEFVLAVHLPVQGRVGHIRLPISDITLFDYRIEYRLPCHQQKTQGAV